MRGVDGVFQLDDIAVTSPLGWQPSYFSRSPTETSSNPEAALARSARGAADLLGCFANARGRIERLALEKLRARPDGVSGRLSLWADDVDFVPPGGAPLAAYQEITRHQSA